VGEDGDLETQFAGEAYTTELNNLGGADRFVLELAARCALRQIGTPGFNWPVAFIDEGFVAFDSSRRARIAETLAAMVSVGGFDKIVMTSHMACVKDVCARTLSISRHDDRSRLVS
jgi:DNA repair exonuclease SbcCD ATPase subunit